MNKEFITEGIQNDRCIKAHRLLDRFETEVRAELERMGEKMVKSHPSLFPKDTDPNIKFKWDTTIIANLRGNIRMNQVNDALENLKLNISLRWVDPVDWGHADVDGALCAACYKLNNGDKEDFEKVKTNTPEQEWDINFADDQYNNAPGVMYIPVETGQQFQDATTELQNHFAEFGDYWGEAPSEVDSSD